MSYSKNILLILSFSLTSLFTLGCHDVSLTETSAIDNGDGTYTYTFELCFGTGAGSETYGFYLDFTGGNLISYDPSVTGPSTGNVKPANVPPPSGVGVIEYGDWDDTGSSLLSGTGNVDCIFVTLTFDAPITSATFGGYQPALACGGTNDPQVITTTSDCFSNTADYTVELTTPNCIGNNVTWNIEDPDGVVIGSGSLAQNGLTETYSVCGCGAVLNLSVPAGSGGPPSSLCSNDMAPDGQIEVFDASGVSLGTATANGETIALDCVPLPIKLGSFTISNIHNDRINTIEWNTLSETNNDYFILEFSSDGKVWSQVSKIDGAGTTTSKNFYQFSHRFTQEGINYYRLKQVDTDGKINVYGIRSVENNIDRKLIKKLNLIGQEVGEDYSGIVIDHYDDGTATKRYQ